MYVCIVLLYLTGFTKTDQIVAYFTLTNINLQYSRHCSSLNMLDL